MLTLTPYLTMPRAALLVLFASLAALIFVFTMQYGFGIEPCILCWWQRLPYTLAVFLALIAWLWRPYGPQSSGLMILCSLVFLCSAGLAIFHSGVELHWWLGTESCHLTPLHGTSVEDLRTQLLHTVVAHCDEISWTFLGLSMANWNIASSLGLAAFSGLAGLRK